MACQYNGFTCMCRSVTLHFSAASVAWHAAKQLVLQPITLETATLCCVIQAASSHSAHAIVQGPFEENIPPIT